MNVASYGITLAPHVGRVWPEIKSRQHFLACVCQANFPSFKQTFDKWPPRSLLFKMGKLSLPSSRRSLSSSTHRPDNYKHPASHLSLTIKQHGRRLLHKQRGEGAESGNRRMRVEWSRVNSEKERGRLTAQLRFLILCLSGPVQSLC